MKLDHVFLVASSASSVIAANVVSMSFTKRHIDAELAPAGSRLGLQKRSPSTSGNPENFLLKRANDYVNADLSNQVVGYYISLEVGTPSQQIDTLLDTGSSDLWFMDSDNTLCLENGSQSEDAINCTGIPTFDSSKSSSFKSNSSADFLIQYGDYSFAEGTFGEDTLKFGDATVKNAIFAVANTTNSSTPVFGIGFEQLESTNAASSTPYTYDNVPILLKNSGAIDSVAYSLYLNDINADNGTILFGGVDHSKYSGSLITIPFVANYDAYGTTQVVAMYVELTEITWDTGKENTTLVKGSAPALLDSGTTLTYVPEVVFDTIANALDANYDSEVGQYTTSCDYNETAGALIYKFNDAQIKVPFSELLLEVTLSDGTPVRSGGTTVCALMLESSDVEDIILGDTFLRSAYVVYDLENKQASIAQANYDSSSADIEAISSSVPSATVDSGASTLTSFTFYGSATTIPSVSLESTVAFTSGLASASGEVGTKTSGSVTHGSKTSAGTTKTSGSASSATASGSTTSRSNAGATVGGGSFFTMISFLFVSFFCLI